MRAGADHCSKLLLRDSWWRAKDKEPHLASLLGRQRIEVWAKACPHRDTHAKQPNWALEYLLICLAWITRRTSILYAWVLSGNHQRWVPRSDTRPAGNFQTMHPKTEATYSEAHSATDKTLNESSVQLARQKWVCSNVQTNEITVTTLQCFYKRNPLSNQQTAGYGQTRKFSFVNYRVFEENCESSCYLLRVCFETQG